MHNEVSFRRHSYSFRRDGGLRNVSVWTRNVCIFTTVAGQKISHALSPSSGCDSTNLGRVRWRTSSSEKSGRRWRRSPTWRRRREMNRMTWPYPGQRCSTCSSTASCRWSRRTAWRCRTDTAGRLRAIVRGTKLRPPTTMQQPTRTRDTRHLLGRPTLAQWQPRIFEVQHPTSREVYLSVCGSGPPSKNQLDPFKHGNTLLALLTYSHAYTTCRKRRTVIPRLHDTTGCQTGCTTGLTTGCIVHTNIQPVVKPVWQPVWQQVVSCKRALGYHGRLKHYAVL